MQGNVVVFPDIPTTLRRNVQDCTLFQINLILISSQSNIPGISKDFALVLFKYHEILRCQSRIGNERKGNRGIDFRMDQVLIENMGQKIISIHAIPIGISVRRQPYAPDVFWQFPENLHTRFLPGAESAPLRYSSFIVYQCIISTTRPHHNVSILTLIVKHLEDGENRFRISVYIPIFLHIGEAYGTCDQRYSDENGLITHKRVSRGTRHSLNDRFRYQRSSISK